MPRFKGIDGLRGWLALLVMFAHIVVFGGLASLYPVLGPIMEDAGNIAVSIFIVISGFVITHLRVEKPESYMPYIGRRFLRIYPVYFLCLILGILTTHLYFNTFLSEPWGPNAPLHRFNALLLKAQTEERFVPNLIAHLTMLHGMVPYDAIHQAPMAFLAPGWSLSLEWQFYLTAPLVVWAIFQSTATRLILAILAVLSYWAFQIGAFGVFTVPSILPGAMPLFAVGIATRVVIPKMPQIAAFPWNAALIGCIFLAMGEGVQLVPFYVWGLFVAWMLVNRTRDQSRLDARSAIDALLDSFATRYAGKLSYAIYLVHMPIIQIIVFLCVRRFHLGLRETALAVVLATPILTILFSLVLHWLVELPAINFGKSLFFNHSKMIEVKSHSVSALT